MKKALKELLYRINKTKGLYLSLLYISLAILFLIVDLMIQDLLYWFPSLLPELEKITIGIMGDLVVFFSIFRIFFYICIFLLIASWFVGLIIELAKIIAAIIVAVVIFAPLGLFKIDVVFSEYTFSISLILNIFFWLYVLIRIINVGLDLYRYKSDLSLDKEYLKKEAEGFREIELSKKPVTRSVLKRIFKEPYEYSWLDSEYEKPKLHSEDKFLLTEWMPHRTKYVTSTREKSRNVLVLYIYVSIYALIVFFFEDGMTAPLDATFRAFSFPIMIYFILGFRSFFKLLKSAIAMLFYIFLAMMLFQARIITANGIFYVYYMYLLLYIFQIIGLLFTNPPEFINSIINGFVPPIDPTDIEVAMAVTDTVMKNYYTIAGIICIFVELAIWLLILRKKKSAIILSNKNIFIRDEIRTSRVNDVKIALTLLVNPISPKNYQTAFKKMQYNRLSSIDSAMYDYGKMPFEALVRVKAKKAVPIYELVIGILWVIGFSGVSILSMINGDNWYDILANVGLAIVVLIPLLYQRKKLHLHDIRLKFDRSKVRGPWIYGHTYTTIEFKDVSGAFVDYFLQYCDPSIIREKITLKRKKEIGKVRNGFLLEMD